MTFDPTLFVLKVGARIPGHRTVARAHRLEALRDLTRTLRIDCMFDVGANVGQFGKELRGIGYKGWIISFEPNPEAFSSLKRVADEKWLCYPLALSSVETRREFNVTKSSDFSSFLVPVNDMVERRILVPTRRLDGMLQEVTMRTAAKRMFLKMDTQGFDVEVVKGCGEKIADFLGLLSELSVTPIYAGMPTYLEALSVYHSLGFKLHSMHLVNECADRSVLEYDAILTKV